LRKGSGYVLGRSRENNLKYKLIRDGWIAFRLQGSAGGLPGPVKPIDVVALKKGFAPRFFQVSRRRSDISRKEKEELLRLAKLAGAEAMLAHLRKRRWILEPLLTA